MLDRPWVQFISSVLLKARYDNETRKLEVLFREGRKEGWVMYSYENVSELLYEDLLAADSPGLFFNRYIRGRYPFQKLESQEAPMKQTTPLPNSEKVETKSLLDESLLSRMFIAVISEEGQSLTGDEIKSLASELSIGLTINGRYFAATTFMKRLEQHIDEEIRNRASSLVTEKIGANLGDLYETLNSFQKELTQKMQEKFGINITRDSWDS